MRKIRFKNLAIGISFAWLAAFVLVPNLLVLAASFLTRDEVRFLAPPLTLDGYARLLDPVYVSVFLRSFLLAVVVTLLCLLVGYPFAYILARQESAWRRFLLLLVIIPFWTNSLIRTYAIQLFLRANGLVNLVLCDWLHILDQPAMLLYTRGAVIAGSVYVLLPFMVLPLYAVIERLDPAYEEAGRDLYAGRLAVFFRIIVPLTMPGIVAGCLLVLLPALGLFYIPDVLGGAKDLFFGNFIKNQFLDARDWPFGAAGSVILTVLMGACLVLYSLVVRRLGRKVF